MAGASVAFKRHVYKGEAEQYAHCHADTEIA